MTAHLQDLSISLLGEIFTVDQLARNRLSKALPKGMELSHFEVLNQLANLHDERTPAQIAKSFHVTKGALTNTLAKLEAAGHIHIRPDWDDARRKLVTISPAGRSARDGALQAITPVIEETVTFIGGDKVRAILPVLRELRIRLEHPG